MLVEYSKRVIDPPSFILAEHSCKCFRCGMQSTSRCTRSSYRRISLLLLSNNLMYASSARFGLYEREGGSSTSSAPSKSREICNSAGGSGGGMNISRERFAALGIGSFDRLMMLDLSRSAALGNESFLADSAGFERSMMFSSPTCMSMHAWATFLNVWMISRFPLDSFLGRFFALAGSGTKVYSSGDGWKK